MLLLIIALAILALVAIFANQLRAFRDDPSVPRPEATAMPAECAACADETAACVAERLLAGACKEIIYFDDEELDSYKGRNPDTYTEEEVETFRDIMFSMKESEVADWLTSLQQRDIPLPDELKDEAFLLSGLRK